MSTNHSTTGNAVTGIDAALAQLKNQAAAQEEDIAGGVAAYRESLADLVPLLEQSRDQRLAIAREAVPRLQEIFEGGWVERAKRYGLTTEAEDLTRQMEQCQSLLGDRTAEQMLEIITNLSAKDIQDGRVPRIRETAGWALAHPGAARGLLGSIEATLTVIAEEIRHRDPVHEYGEAPPRPRETAQAETEFTTR